MHGSHGGHGTESADDGPPPHQGGESRHHRPEAPEQKDPR
jgi:hypothetical protein